ncbi:methyltransferase domain-containing protein [Actinoplanes sp. TBRC 11911]|uniref:THUMP-like domain-containing protein n=1 Tax=Actinoplanes sp. TBRC 11911 TaxID=2729386 RepID=UPI00145CC9F0|nr:methyltransferase domain-containing protein [Actinoplanes sp. TBRC 11911]NMO56461.1 methyltransferase domain-containing protein [Actinoplanes sp. TBRC 11911]
MHTVSPALLRTPEGVTALAAATEVAGADPLVAAATLRARGVPADLASAALTQVDLRRRAVAKFGPAATSMFFTRAGLEQATRAVVADRRAARLAAAGVRTMADLGCGVGSDALAAARAGISVYAVDADPVTAEVAAANVVAAGLSDLVRVECVDATTVRVEDFDAVFADPARRRAGGGRVFDPKSYSPPWDFVAGLAGRVPRTVLKLAPGIDHDLLPPGAEGEWVSVGGDLVEAAFWCGPLAEVPRRATLLPGETGASVLTGSGDAKAPVGPVGRFLYDPDPAVVRAHLVAEFAASIGGRLADPDIAYVYTDEPLATPYGRRLEITDVMPFSLKRLRALLRERGVGRLEIRKRGSALEPDQLRRQLRLSGPEGASIVLTRVLDAPVVILCR